MSREISKKLLVLFILAPAIASVGIVTVIIVINLPEPNQDESFESKIQSWMTDGQIPSLGACIVINESVVWAKGFGDQPDLDTVYMIGSITKSFTATAILQLYEKNLIDLGINIDHYLPFKVRHPNYTTSWVTTEMLLTHTSGLSTNLYWSLEYYFNNETITWINENLDLGGDIEIWEDRPTLEQFLNGSLNPGGAYYDDYNWQSRPGLFYRYSNAGYQLLGYLVEAITNQTLIDYVQENILDPLNMSSSGFYYEDFLNKNAIPYEWMYNFSLPFYGYNFELPHYNINVTGAGQIRSTIPDMSKYLIACTNGGEYNGVQILKSSSINLMQSIRLPLSGSSAEGLDFIGYGYGWLIYERGYKGHGGATPGFSANIYFKKTSGGSYGALLMFNRGSALIYDERLIKTYLPAINTLLLEEAESLFEQARSS